LNNGAVGVASNINNEITPFKGGFKPGPTAFMVFIGLQSGVFLAMMIYMSYSEGKLQAKRQKSATQVN
jgi:hypothetical protein